MTIDTIHLETQRVIFSGLNNICLQGSLQCASKQQPYALLCSKTIPECHLLSNIGLLKYILELTLLEVVYVFLSILMIYLLHINPMDMGIVHLVSMRLARLEKSDWLKGQS